MVQLAVPTYLAIFSSLRSISALYVISNETSTQTNGLLLSANDKPPPITLLSSNISASADGFTSDFSFLTSDSVSPNRPICKGDMFGYGLSLPSCHDALGRISNNPADTVLANRSQDCDVKLPHRFSSSE